MSQQVLQELLLVGELEQVKERMRVSQLEEEPLPHLHLSVVRTQLVFEQQEQQVLELRVLLEQRVLPQMHL